MTPRPKRVTSPPLPAAHALVLELAPPSETTADADADAEAEDTPDGDPVLVALTLLPLAVRPPAPPPPPLPPVACGPPVGAAGALPLLPL